VDDRDPTPWLTKLGDLEVSIYASLSAKMDADMVSPRKGSSFSGSSQWLDACRLEEYLFGVDEQVNEQRCEQEGLS